jgi:hypothetical protein
VGGQIPDILDGDLHAISGGLGEGMTLWDLGDLTPVGDLFPHVTDYRQPTAADGRSNTVLP